MNETGQGSNISTNFSVNLSDWESSAPVHNCAYHIPVNFTRFTLIFSVFSSIASLGVIFNIFLVYFFSGARHRESPTLYLQVLAFLDASICACYVLLFGADAAILYLQIDWWYEAWTYYGIPMFLYSRVVQLSSVYVIAAGTLERFILATIRSWCHNDNWLRRILGLLIRTRSRYAIVGLIILFSTILRFSTVVEMRVELFSNCTDRLGQMSISFSKYAKIFSVFNVYVLPLIQVVIPFVTLFSLNCAIIIVEKRQFQKREHRRGSFNRSCPHQQMRFPTAQDVGSAELGRRFHRHSDLKMVPLSIGYSASGVLFRRTEVLRESRKDQKGLKKATRMFVAIIGTYLITNSLHLFVMILETVPSKPWLTYSLPNVTNPEGVPAKFPTSFYVLTTDLISVLFMLNSFFRVFIYLIFNKHMRGSLLRSLVCLRSRDVEEASSSEEGSGEASLAHKPSVITHPRTQVLQPILHLRDT